MSSRLSRLNETKAGDSPNSGALICNAENIVRLLKKKCTQIAKLRISVHDWCNKGRAYKLYCVHLATPLYIYIVEEGLDGHGLLLLRVSRVMTIA